MIKYLILLLLLAGVAVGDDYWERKDLRVRIPDRWTFEVDTTQRQVECPDYDGGIFHCAVYHSARFIDTTWTKKVPVFLTPKQADKLTKLLNVIEFTDTLDAGCEVLWLKQPLYVKPDPKTYIDCSSAISAIMNWVKSGYNPMTITASPESAITDSPDTIGLWDVLDSLALDTIIWKTEMDSMIYDD